MRLGSAAALAAVVLLTSALPALAAPVHVTLKTPYGVVGPGLPVVAFSYDVERVFPEVERRFEQWKPLPPLPNGNFKPLPNVRGFGTFYLTHALQLEHYRDDFARTHKGDQAMLRDLMPRFDAIFRKHGERASDVAENYLHPQDERQVWCQKVAADLNAVIDDFNTRNGAGEGGLVAYRQAYARWLGKRNEALRFAAMQAGGNPNLNFVESVTNGEGIASFDLPAGTWWMAALSSSFSWYRPVRVTTLGGRVTLAGNDASRRRIALYDWIGS